MLEENEENNKVLDQYEDFRRSGQDTLLLLKENLLKNQGNIKEKKKIAREKLQTEKGKHDFKLKKKKNIEENKYKWKRLIW